LEESAAAREEEEKRQQVEEGPRKRSGRIASVQSAKEDDDKRSKDELTKKSARLKASADHDQATKSQKQSQQREDARMCVLPLPARVRVAW
jgi:hypothetical protein